jgi:hypothetical protein
VSALDRNGGDGRICKARIELGFRIFGKEREEGGCEGLYRGGIHAKLEWKAFDSCGIQFGFEDVLVDVSELKVGDDTGSRKSEKKKGKEKERAGGLAAGLLPVRPGGPALGLCGSHARGAGGQSARPDQAIRSGFFPILVFRPLKGPIKIQK